MDSGSSSPVWEMVSDPSGSTTIVSSSRRTSTTSAGLWSSGAASSKVSTRNTRITTPRAAFLISRSRSRSCRGGSSSAATCATGCSGTTDAAGGSSVVAASPGCGDFRARHTAVASAPAVAAVAAKIQSRFATIVPHESDGAPLSAPDGTIADRRRLLQRERLEPARGRAGRGHRQHYVIGRRPVGHAGDDRCLYLRWRPAARCRLRAQRIGVTDDRRRTRGQTQRHRATSKDRRRLCTVEVGPSSFRPTPDHRARPTRRQRVTRAPR